MACLRSGTLCRESLWVLSPPAALPLAPRQQDHLLGCRDVLTAAQLQLRHAGRSLAVQDLPGGGGGLITLSLGAWTSPGQIPLGIRSIELLCSGLHAWSLSQGTSDTQSSSCCSPSFHPCHKGLSSAIVRPTSPPASQGLLLPSNKQASTQGSCSPPPLTSP